MRFIYLDVRPVSPLRGKLLPSLWGRLQVYSARASHICQTIKPVSPLRGKLLSLLWGRLQVYSARASHSANKSSAFDLSFCAAESQIRPCSKFAKASFRKQLHFTARQQLSTPFPDSDVKAELRFEIKNRKLVCISNPVRKSLRLNQKLRRKMVVMR